MNAILRKSAGFAILALSLALLPQDAAAQGRGGRGGGMRGVYKAQVTPHWFDKDTKFWYRNDLRGGAREFVLVDAEKGGRAPAFDHQKLAAALSKAAGQEFKADKLPFGEIEFIDSDKALKFSAAGKSWRCNLSSYECTGVAESSGDKGAMIQQLEDSQLLADAAENDASSSEANPSPEFNELDPAPQQQQQQDQTAQRPNQVGRGRRGAGGNGGGGRGFRSGPVRSPDEKWSAMVRDYNIVLRSEPDGKEEQLTEDGKDGAPYGMLTWSPDSKALAAWRIESGDRKEVFLIQSSPTDAGRAKMTSRPYAQAGDKFTTYEVGVIDIASHKFIKPQIDKFEHEYETPSVHWSRDNQHFTYLQEDRGHQRLRLIEVDARSGSTRNLVDEQTKTFIWTAHTEGPARYGFKIFTYLTNSDEVINMSERDGWRHMYLVDPKTGGIPKQITKGEWVVRGITRVDEDKRQIWFCASGMNADQDPYFIHFYRINFDGTGLVALTEGNGNHSITNSPDGKFFIDTYSRPDMPPANELRRTADGKKVCALEQADISELKETGWTPPEAFVAKGRDSKTDIWGLINRPRDFDPQKKYPILEDIYNGPQDSYTPKSFSGASRYESYNRLGFVVVKLDAMGTANRSKAFHDVCWHNLKDGGFPDRIAWIKAAAEKHQEMDIDRVGIFGTSAGGQNAAAAVLFHPEFYKVAVANSGCHDNRLDKASWNEQWMGYQSPEKIWSKDEDNWYSQCSNIDNAAKLKGKLFLIVGEMDSNVPPESTMRFVDALIKAGKDFDLLVVPGADHGAGSPVTSRRTQDYFVANLLHKEIPNRNAGTQDAN